MMRSSKGKLAGCAFFFFLGVLVLICSAVAMFWNAAANAIYESKTVFQITPTVVSDGQVDEKTIEKLVELGELPHGQRISSPTLVGTCITANGLFVLDSFVGMPATQVVGTTAANVQVTELGLESNIYEVSLTSSNPQDCATILNNLVRSYLLQLEKEYPEFTGHYEFRLLAFARVGDQIYPILPYNIAIGMVAALIVATVVWFLFDPLAMKYSRFSIADVVWMIMLAACFFCLALALKWYSGGITEYESTALLQIKDQVAQEADGGTEFEQRLFELNQENHFKILTQYLTVENALTKNNHFVLDPFRKLAKEEVVEFVQDNLHARPDTKNPNDILISYRSKDPAVAKDVLQGLVDSYEKSLKKRSETGDDSWLQLQQYKVANGLEKSPFLASKKFLTQVVQQPTAGQSVTSRLQMQRTESLIAAFIAVWLAIACYLTWKATRGLKDVAAEPAEIEREVMV